MYINTLLIIVIPNLNMEYLNSEIKQFWIAVAIWIKIS